MLKSAEKHICSIIFFLVISLYLAAIGRSESEIESIISLFKQAAQSQDFSQCKQPDTSFAVRIDNRVCAFPGDTVRVPVSLRKPPFIPWGFDFSISYDTSVLQLVWVDPGPDYFSETGCGWEYFNFRIGYSPNCTPPTCWPPLIRIVGLSDVNSPISPNCLSSGKTSDLFYIIFKAKKEGPGLNGLTPINFYWADCGDNTFAFKYEDDNYGSQTVLASLASRVLIGNSELTRTDSFPTFAGPSDSCFSDPNSHYYYIYRRIMDFYNGGVKVNWFCDPDDVGDVNLNGISHEIVDAILFAKYFLNGISAFTVNPTGQIYSTDVNGDGNSLMLEDLVQLIRIATGDLRVDWTFDSSLLGLNAVINDYGNNYIQLRSKYCANIVWLKIAGDVTPHPTPHPRIILHHFDGIYTNVLAVSLSGFETRPDTLFSYTGNGKIIAAQAATFEGYEVPLTIFDFSTDVDDNSDPLPTDFSLHQNYPNPFNNSTVISIDLPKASDVEFEIINLLGQTVYRTEKRYSAGSHSVSWDGIDQSGLIVSSGVYYYRIVACDFVESKKMILLK